MYQGYVPDGSCASCSPAEIGPLPRRDRSYSGSRSVRFRVEIPASRRSQVGAHGSEPIGHEAGPLVHCSPRLRRHEFGSTDTRRDGPSHHRLESPLAIPMTAVSGEGAHVADQHITAVGNLGRRRGVTNRPHRARHDILARLHDEDPVYRILHPFGEPSMRVAPPSTIRHRRPRGTEHLRAQRHQGADVEYGRSSDNNSIIHAHEPTAVLKRTRRAELTAQAGQICRAARPIADDARPAVRHRGRRTGRTDLDAEADRSRAGVRPISAKGRRGGRGAISSGLAGRSRRSGRS